MQVCYYRDKQSINKFKLATVTAAGVKITEPFALETEWGYKVRLFWAHRQVASVTKTMLASLAKRDPAPTDAHGLLHRACFVLTPVVSVGAAGVRRSHSECCRRVVMMHVQTGQACICKNGRCIPCGSVAAMWSRTYGFARPLLEM